ncbi:MAG: tetratricopeptide repeat protein [Alphaproteobacteria bacterium]|nr:tetratricopeptide repeat protein [Alphaproteobacteria bacterium]MDE2041833.1 tetratricopeptide repeat protein [Alphaproteobacteria bacterium]MDE2340818.1 tetratricopeptide repeat protein [Alphaproteobacteria bacterium]
MAENRKADAAQEDVPLSSLLEQAQAYGSTQHLIEADELLARALRQCPDDFNIALLHAQNRYVLGYPVAALFERICAQHPGSTEAARLYAQAMISEGEGEGAEALLVNRLTDQPDWLDGHKLLAQLRWTRGDQLTFDTGYAAACARMRAHAALWFAWYGTAMLAKNWARALEILDRAERHIAGNATLAVARAIALVEAGDAGADAALRHTEAVNNDMLALARVRHALRRHDLVRAEAAALPVLRGRTPGLIWPYLSLVWRLRGDRRAAWLDQPEYFIRAFDVGLSATELADLATTLRTLHTASAPYIEQSVRGGTQTDRSVLLRHEPILQHTRAALMDAVRSYIDGLPMPEPAHPLLGRPRGQLRIEGSWSVRLTRQGYNVAHTHPMGWLSSAFYVAVPPVDTLGPAPAGWISFGEPPPELGVDLAPYQQIAPEVGRLVLFPSTMWHRTVPFEDGERLVIAFDVQSVS